jgi:hypothetical protein
MIPTNALLTYKNSLVLLLHVLVSHHPQAALHPEDGVMPKHAAAI